MVCINIIQFDSDGTNIILLYGGGALVALWFASAIVGAIDSIPLVRVYMFCCVELAPWNYEQCLFSESGKLD